MFDVLKNLDSRKAWQFMRTSEDRFWKGIFCFFSSYKTEIRFLVALASLPKLAPSSYKC
jgi:hypothetical protein